MAVHTVSPKKGVAPVLALVPENYSQRYLQELVRQLQLALNEIYSQQFAVGNLPTTAAGLKVGQMYLDASGYVRIVQTSS